MNSTMWDDYSHKNKGSAGEVSVFQITILFLYAIAGVLLALSRLSRYEEQRGMFLALALINGLTGLLWHAGTLALLIVLPEGIALSIGNTASFIGLQLAIIGLLGSVEPKLRGLAGGLLVLAAMASAMTGTSEIPRAAEPINWQVELHILASLFAYGLLTVGAIIAVYALVQEKRLRSRRLSSFNQLFAPLETTEKLLFGVTTTGFLVLIVAVSTGFAFVDNLFAQHLVHKTALSLLALALFGVLLAGRRFAGWRGRRAIYLYLGAFLILCLAYFGSRFILEEILGRSWG
jgi:ABC-type uncharacterized transport system permease subunit